MTAVEEVTKETIEIAVATMKGQLRNLVLDHLRQEREGARLPWPQLPEDQQHEIINRVDISIEDAIRAAVGIIADNGRQAVLMNIDQLTVKDGLKIVCTAPYTDDSLRLIGGHVKKAAYIILADAEEFMGGDKPKVQDPTEPELPLAGAHDDKPIFDQTNAGSDIAAEREDVAVTA